MKKLFFLFVMVMLVNGCATLNSVPNGQCKWNSVWGGTMCNNYEVEFVSDPPGAKIEINNNYIGETPIKQRWLGTYSDDDYWTVTAYPTQASQYTQTKILRMNNLPKRVYFNMYLGPVTPSVNVNINQ